MAARQRRIVNQLSDDPLANYDEIYLECRSVSHRWDVIGFFRDPYGGVVRQMLCSRCDTGRRDIWTSTGQRVTNRYDYAEGYQIRGHGGVSRNDVRKATLRRVRVFGSEHEMIANVVNGKGRS